MLTACYPPGKKKNSVKNFCLRSSCKTLKAVVFDYTLQDRKTPSPVSPVNEVAEKVLSSHEMV